MKTTPAVIDAALRENVDYHVTLSRSTPGGDTWRFSGRGIHGVMEALARVLVVMSKSGFTLPDVDFSKKELKHALDMHPGASEKFQLACSQIENLRAMINSSPDENSRETQEERAERDRLRQRAHMLLGMVNFKQLTVTNRRMDVDFAMMIRQIIEDVQADVLDLDAPVAHAELLPHYGRVPSGEPRCTTGALIYYYVQHLAEEAGDRLVVEAATASR